MENKILHLGCGTNIIDGFQNYDIDTKAGAKQINLNEPLPFEDNSIDGIVISHTLCILLDKREPLVKEMYRVLKEDGWLRIIDNPFRFYANINESANDIHSIARSELVKWLEGAGFKDIIDIDKLETTIDRNLLNKFEIARAGHGSFIIEAKKYARERTI